MPTSLETDLPADVQASAATTFTVGLGGTAHGGIGLSRDVVAIIAVKKPGSSRN
jgi:hypothetical protein